MKLKIKAGTTSRIARIFIQDSTQTNGAGLTGLVYNSSGLKWYYSRVGDSTSTAVTLVTAAIGTYTSAGFVAVDGTNMPGVYEIGLPNAALTGATAVHLMLYGATNMVPVLLEIELDAVDYQDATKFGLTNLDAAVSTRSTYAGADTSGTTTLLARLTSTRSGYLDNLSAGAVALASQIPPNFTTALFASAGVFSVGALANAPGGSGSDPWLTPLPGSYSAGQAGYILGHPLTVGTNNDKGGYSLAAAGLDSITIEAGVNARQALAVDLAASAGVLIGAGTGTIVIKGGNTATTRITATTDSVGNRTAVTLNLPT